MSDMHSTGERVAVQSTGEISGYFANLFGLRWVLDRFGYDPCDEWDIDMVLGLPEGLSYMGGSVKFQCRACETWTTWEGEISDFEDGHYANVCGGSPRCCP